LSIILSDLVMLIQKKAIKFSTVLYPRAGGQIIIICDDQYILSIFFFTKELEQRTPHKHVHDAERNIGTAYEEMWQYPYYLDLLRNADQVYVKFDDSATRLVFEIEVPSVPVGEWVD
jgi:hypothetical protein